MNNIIITEEHIQKLLEMCTTLYTDKDFTFRCGVEPNQAIGFSPKGFKYPFEEIHWFEFCLLHLAKRMFNKPLKKGEHGYSWHLREMADRLTYSTPVNPIDYLFTHFKQSS